MYSCSFCDLDTNNMHMAMALSFGWSVVWSFDQVKFLKTFKNFKNGFVNVWLMILWQHYFSIKQALSSLEAQMNH